MIRVRGATRSQPNSTKPLMEGQNNGTKMGDHERLHLEHHGSETLRLYCDFCATAVHQTQ